MPRNVIHEVYNNHDAFIENFLLERNFPFQFTMKWDCDKEQAIKSLINSDWSFSLAARKQSSSSDEFLFFDEDSAISIFIGRGEINVDFYAHNHTKNGGNFLRVQELVPRSILEEDDIKVNFWTLGQHGPQSHVRKIFAPSWDEVSWNYTDKTARDFSELINHEFDEKFGGKLILWHGPPGTGKTFALRALARETRDWLNINYIVDPEKFFGSEAAYMMSVILSGGDPISDDDDDTPPPQWRLLVLEDTGELLTRDAKERAGQGLSRLLNVCDGLIGQGLHLLVLITTNEDLGSLNEAVTRPGRCVSNVEFGPLSASESSDWLKRNGMDVQRVSQSRLAELYAILNGEEHGGKVPAGFVP